MDLAEGDEEAQLAAMLAALESRASRDIAQLATSSLENQAAFNAQSAAIRDGLAAVRAAMRELEALTEEQDTCAHIACPILNQTPQSIQKRYYWHCKRMHNAQRLHAARCYAASINSDSLSIGHCMC